MDHRQGWRRRHHAQRFPRVPWDRQAEGCQRLRQRCSTVSQNREIQHHALRLTRAPKLRAPCSPPLPGISKSVPRRALDASRTFRVPLGSDVSLNAGLCSRYVSVFKLHGQLLKAYARLLKASVWQPSLTAWSSNRRAVGSNDRSHCCDRVPQWCRQRLPRTLPRSSSSGVSLSLFTQPLPLGFALVVRRHFTGLFMLALVSLRAHRRRIASAGTAPDSCYHLGVVPTSAVVRASRSWTCLGV